VTAAAGGTGIEGVEVCAFGVEAAIEEEEGCELTGAGGSYEITDLATGRYKVEFWPRELNYVWQYFEDTQEWSAATPVSVSTGSITEGVDAALAKGAAIGGTVTAAATGLPVAGIEVCAFSEASEGAFRCASTNSVGAYRIVGLQAGSYTVYFYPEGSGQGLIGQGYDDREFDEEPDLVPLAAGGEANRIDAVLQKGGTITGTVRLAATNAPLAGVRVCLTEAGFPEAFGCLTTPASGGYKFTSIWRGSFKIAFSAEGGEVFDPGAVVDSYPTQWWNMKSSFTAGTPIRIIPPGEVSGIDAYLGPPAASPTSSSSSSAPATTAVRRRTKPPVKCRRGFLKRKVHGKARCVKRHKPRHHRHQKHR
jgi:hypothetical protein